MEVYKIPGSLKWFKEISWILSVLVFATAIKFSQSAVVTAKTSEELQNLLKTAAPGDEIELLPIDYRGSFTLEKKGNGKGVTIYGTSKDTSSTVFSPSPGKSDSTAFTVDGSSWTIRDITIQDFGAALAIKGNGVAIKLLTIKNCKNGIQIDGNDVSVMMTTIEGATEGVNVGGQDFDLKMNVITASKTSLNIQSNVKAGTLTTNTFNGPVIISGSNLKFTSNVAKDTVLIEGSENRFTTNVFKQPVSIIKEDNQDDGGNTFEYASGSKQLQSKFGRFANFMGNKFKKF